MSSALLLILCALFTFYLYLRKRQKYWTELGVPSVDRKFLFEIAWDYPRGHRSLEEITEDVYWSTPNAPFLGSYSALMRPILFVRDPEIIYRLTIKDFNHFPIRQPPLTAGGRLIHNLMLLAGEEWKTVRSKLMPTFSRRKLKGMYHLVEECAQTLVDEHFR